MLIGFAGLGRMGRPMASNLVKAGHTVSGYDPSLSGDSVDGVRLLSQPDELLGADLSISMLPNDATTENLVLTGLAGGNREHLHIVMGTVSPSLVRKLAETAAVQVIDSPVSGSVSIAEAGALSTMTGGSAQQFEQARPVLAAMTTRQFHTGPVGTGATAKLAVNAVLAVLSQAVAESLLLAERAGLDTPVFYDVLRTSAVAAPYLEYKQEVYLHPENAPVAAPIGLIRKDIGLALDVASENELNLPTIQAARELLDTSIADGLADADMGQVLAALRGLNASTTERNQA